MNKNVIAIMACYGLLLTTTLLPYRKVCYAAYDFSGNNQTASLVYPMREKLPFDPEKAHYSYLCGQVRCYVHLKDKDLRNIKKILLGNNYKLTAPLSESLIARIEPYNKMVAQVVRDFKMGYPHSTVKDVLLTLKIMSE